MPPPPSEAYAIERLIREDWGRAMAALTRRLGDMTLAEDALQDAVVRALEVWPAKGVPTSPLGWLIAVAGRRAIDLLRRDATKERNAALIAIQAEMDAHPEPELRSDIPDKRLELIFTCCHPAIGEKSQVALTLRALGGLTTAEIAAAFLDKPEAMAARLTRVKTKIRDAGIPFAVPQADALPDRIVAVTRVIYLIFNEGYRASSGTHYLRGDLCDEAIRLGRTLGELLSDQAEVAGLLALMLLHDSRRHARGKDGAVVALEDQNRARWDRGKIAEGLGHLERAMALGSRGPFTIQAAISALHAEAPDFAQTDWAQIGALYDALYRIEPSPVVLINRAVALNYCNRSETALSLLDQVEAAPGMSGYQPLRAAKAEVLASLGRMDEAASEFDRAIALCANPAERAMLADRAARRLTLTGNQ